MLMPLVAITWIMTVALAGFLVWGFLRTRNYGYLVLLIPFGLWHLLTFVSGPILESQIAIIQTGQRLDFPFSLMGEPTAGHFVAAYQLIRRIVRGLFILLGFYLLIQRTPRASAHQGVEDLEGEETSLPA